MQIRAKLLMSTAIFAALAATASGQGFGYPQATHHSASSAARRWSSASWVQRARTGHVGFMATNGCDNKPICSLCDYSRPRDCGCNDGHGEFLTSLVSWLSYNPGGCASQKCPTQKCATQKYPTQKSAPQKCAVQKSAPQKCAVQKSAPQKCAVQKSAPQKCAVQKCAPQKCAVQKCAPQKCPVQKRAPQKCPVQKKSVQKSAPQKCVVQKSAPQKCVTQKSSKSCCAKSGGPGLLESITSGLFACHSNCGCKSKSKSGCQPQMGYQPQGCEGGCPMTLPVPTWGDGEVPPAGDDLPEAVDPSVPPEPFLDDADGGSVGTGVRSAESNNRGTWRRTRESRGVPRLLPSQTSGRGVSPISYQELITPQSSQNLDAPETKKQTDVFQVADTVEATSANSTVPSNVAPLNPLRR